MKWLNKIIDTYRFRSFQKELSSVRTNISQEEKDIFLSGLWQNAAFRSYASARENAIILSMANHQMKPSDDEFQELQGRRKELMDFMTAARSAYNRRERMIARKKEKTRSSMQASA